MRLATGIEPIGLGGVISLDRWGVHRLRRPLEPGYCLALGGEATAGRQIENPWPQLLERVTGHMVLNLGLPHAGVDAMLTDSEAMRLATGAMLRLIEVPDAITLSNPFYTVHPRRNDRLLQVEPRMRRLYPDIDFSEFGFIRHLILALSEHDPRRFEVLRLGLAEAWIERMELLLDRLDGPAVLIWWGNRAPLPPGHAMALQPGAPLLVDREMLGQVRQSAQGLVELLRPIRLVAGAEAAPASQLPDDAAHARVAEVMSPWVRLQA